jgi:GntR family transcriptional repressor for pyruvate dehydrogenase complex
MNNKSTAPAPAPQTFRQVHTRRTFEEVASQVREMVFGGSLKAGDRLPPERELSVMLGVGRPALREALRALEVGGLIELRKGKTGGAFISSGQQSVVSSGMSDMLRLRNVSVAELFEAREWILTSLVRPACRRITAEEIAGLYDNVKRAEQLHKQGRFDERIDTNFEFHMLLAQATRNQLAVSVLLGMTDALRSLIHQVGTDLGPNFFSRRRRLIKALEDRDEEAAARRIAEIVKATEQTYMRLAQERMGESIDLTGLAEAEPATQETKPTKARPATAAKTSNATSAATNTATNTPAKRTRRKAAD